MRLEGDGYVLGRTSRYNGAVMDRRVQVLTLIAFWVATPAGWVASSEPDTNRPATRSRSRASWDFETDLQVGSGAENPHGDALGFDDVWHLLRTSRSTGSVETRTWHRDGRYVPLTKRSDRLFDEGITAVAYQVSPKPLAPFAGRCTTGRTGGLAFKPGDTLVAPGPDHALVVGWRSPVAGVLEIEGEFRHAQNCCGGNSQVNWYVERGPAPDPVGGFQPESLARGVSDFGTPTERGRFHIKGLKVQPGDFVYFILDARADGSGTPHHGDATRLVARLTVDGAEIPDAPSYETGIQPLLARHCTGCHGNDTQEGKLNLSSLAGILAGGESGPAIVRGDLKRSFLAKLVQAREMPPKGETSLSKTERQLLRRWILAGAPAEQDPGDVAPLRLVSAEDRTHWSFQKLKRPGLPPVSSPARVRTPVDTFVLNRLESRGLDLAADADRMALLRRTSLDLLGLPPSLEMQRSFARDTSPGAYARLVDRLLSDPRYGERWGRHWLDAAGYVDVRLFDGDAGTIYVNEGIWRYRDYCISAHNADMAWDRFITEQLAGDELVAWDTMKRWTPDVRQKLVATGYLRSIEDPTSEKQYGVKERYDVLFDTMKTVSSSLMGLTLECARCHSHKYDPIPQRDFYRFMACFEPALNVHDWRKPQQRKLQTVSSAEKAEIDAHNAKIDAEVKTLSEKLKAAGNAGAASEDANGLQQQIEMLKRSKRRYGIIQALWDVGADSPSTMLRRGQWNKPGIRVDAGFLEVLSAGRAELAKRPVDARPGSSGRRLALARWLTREDHPLTARVIVNRAWHHHFGRGIVSTPGNLGRNGAPPSHPDLLSWLAADFVEHGWSLKHLHRRILLSTTYRQASHRPTPEEDRAISLDPDNVLLWRFHLRRMESEAIRDAVLSVAGQLDASPGGPPVMLTTPASGLSMVKPGPAPFSVRRRSVYLLARRVYPLRFLELFDSPIVPVNCTKRPLSATVLQSLALLNSQFLTDAALAMAERVRGEAGGDVTAQIQLAFRLSLCRDADAHEIQVCREFLVAQAQGGGGGAALRDLCQMLLCTNEFLYSP